MSMLLKPAVIAAMALPIVTMGTAASNVIHRPASVTLALLQPEKPVAPRPVEKSQAKPAAQPEVKPNPATPPQPATKPSETPAPAKPPEPTQPDETLPNLDDLLGIPSQPKTGEAGVADPSKMDLDRMLTGEEIGDAFKEAAVLMGDAAKRLKDGKDASLTTQRLQESIVRRLDQLLSSLDQQQQQSSSSQPQQKNQEKKQNQNVPSQQQTERKDQSKNENDGTATNPPGRRDGALRPGLEAVRSSWGMLPERVRDMLVQGSNDTFSSMYEKMTEAYYKKLAEQGKAK